MQKRPQARVCIPCQVALRTDDELALHVQGDSHTELEFAWRREIAIEAAVRQVAASVCTPRLHYSGGMH